MKEKSIIEKLGITPGPWKHSDGMGYIFADRIGGCTMKMQNMTVANTRGYGCLQYHGEEKAHAEMEANEHLIAAAPEMLEALIVTYKLFDRIGEGREKDAIEILRVIEKACHPKSWEEIKEML